VRKIYLLIFGFAVAFLNLAILTFADYYPYPYYQNDNLWTLENESWYYYKKFGIDIRHEKIVNLYTVDINGNPVLQSDGVENNWGTVLINASDYPVKWYWVEAESSNISKVGNWNITTDVSDFNSTNVNSSSIGSYLEFEFVGSGFSIIYDKCPACGYIDVYINDSLFTQIDTYAGTVSHKQWSGIYFSQNDVPVNVKLKVSSTKNPSATNYFIVIDAVKFGSSRYRVYLHDKLAFPDGKYYKTAPGSNTANFLISYHYLGYYGWAVIYRLTFYVLVKNPNSYPVQLNISDNSGFYDFINGSQQTTAGKPYCSITIPPNTDWTLLKLGYGSPYCAPQTNNTWAGTRRTILYYSSSVSYTNWLGQSYRISANASNLWIDSFWVAYDREQPQIIIKNARTGEDLSNGGWISCDDIYGRGINITVLGLPPTSTGWRIRLLSPNTYSWTYVTSPTLTADTSGTISWNNVIDSSARLCKDFDFANWFFVYVDNIYIPGTTGSTFGIQSPPILTTPWDWNFPELKIINLNTGKEEYVLKPNQNYEVRVNITNSSYYPIGSGITVYFSFTHVYGTEGLKGGYENPILLDGSIPFLLWSDRAFALYYNSTGGYWYRKFTTPSQWKYDGHLTYLRLRITNNTNSTYRIRYATSELQLPVYAVIFSNHFYSGSGIDVVAKDIDFGTSWNHPFYTTSGGAPPTFNDNNNDLWIEDSRKIIMIYNSTPGTVAQTPIIWYDKLTGLVHYTSGGIWAPGYSYLGTYKQVRNVKADLGLSRDYSAVLLEESNSLGYNYKVTLYIPANSDYMDVFFDLPDIYTLDFIWQTFNMRGWGNMRYFNVTRIYLETLFGKEEVLHLFRPFTTTGVANVGGWAFSNVTAKAPSYYLGFTTTLPMPTTDGLTPCYPYCFNYLYTEFMYGFNISRNNYKNFYNNWRFVFGILITEGLDEYRSETRTWSTFNFNYGILPNFNMRKVRARFILGNLLGPSDNGTMLLTENKTWRYGYPTSYTGSSVDIYFDRISRSYSVGENVLIFLKARNYTSMLPFQLLNIYILDDGGNIVYQIQQATDSNGLLNISFTPQKTGVYRVKAVGNGLFGIGFFWVRKVQQSISLDKAVYQPGDTVNIKDFVYDSATGLTIMANVNCYAYNQVNEKVWEGSLTKVGNYYQGSFIISPTASVGIWKLSCTANDGSSIDTTSVNFPVSKATESEKQIQSIELSAPAYVLTNTNFTVEVFVRNMGNSLVDCNNVTLTVIDGLRNLIIYNNLNMTWRETGKYYSILNVSSESVYLLRATCNINNLTYLSNPAIVTSQRQITEQSIWSYSNRTLTNYNQTDILSKLSDVNSTVYTIKKIVDCSLPSNSILCSYLDNINNTVSYIKQNMATYVQVQGLISDVSWLKANVATQDAMANNFTIVKNMLTNMNTTLLGIANNLTSVNQTIAQKIDGVRGDVIWIMNNIATKDEIASNFTTTFSKLDKINSTLYEVRDYLYNDITSKLNYINTTQITYFPMWNTTFYYWNGSYFAVWNGSIMDLNSNWKKLWLYWNCSNENNTVCGYLKEILSRNATVDYEEISRHVWSAREAEELIEIVEKIWNVVRPTNQSVITGEALISNTLSSRESIVYQVNISVPEKEGYNTGDWVPIRINFWFVNNSECVSQSTSNIITPYCEPLTTIFLGKIGSNVTQTITMRPINLEPGKVYKVIREVSIDPDERWIVYGRGEIGYIYVFERNQEKKVITNATYSFSGVPNTYQNQIYNQENSVKNEQNMLKLIVAGIIVIVIVFLAYKTKKEELFALIFLVFLFAPVIGAQEIGTVNYIDDIPPNITVISPEPKTYDKAFIDLIYVVSDNVAVDKCWYELNGNISDLPWCNNKTLNLPSGHYDLKVYVNDTSGNTINYRVVFDVSIGGTPYYGVGLMNFYISLNITPSTQYLEIYKYGKLILNKTVTKGEIISLVPGTYTFVFSAEGYKTKKIDLNVTRSFILTVKLEEQKSFSQTSILDQIKENLTPNKLVDLLIISLIIIFLYLVLKEKLIH